MINIAYNIRNIRSLNKDYSSNWILLTEDQFSYRSNDALFAETNKDNIEFHFVTIQIFFDIGKINYGIFKDEQLDKIIVMNNNENCNWSYSDDVNIHNNLGINASQVNHFQEMLIESIKEISYEILEEIAEEKKWSSSISLFKIKN